MTHRIAVVTGGAGFIGRHLVHALAAEGTMVRVVDPAPVPAEMPAGVDYRSFSMLDGAGLKSALEGADELYHVAAIAHLWTRDRADYERVNVEGTRCVLAAAAQARVPSIVVTSTETILRAWHERDGAPITAETTPPPPDALAGAYTRSKGRAHRLALEAAEAGLPVRIVYPTIPLGPGDFALTPPSVMVRDFLLGHTPAYLDSLMNFVPVEDAARGHILAARLGVPQGRYILGGEDIWLSEFLRLIERLSGRPMPKQRIPYWLAYVAGVATTTLADHVTRREPKAPLEGVRLFYAPRPVDSSASRHALGFAPGPVEAAATRLLAWLESEGLVPRRANR